MKKKVLAITDVSPDLTYVNKQLLIIEQMSKGASGINALSFMRESGIVTKDGLAPYLVTIFEHEDPQKIKQILVGLESSGHIDSALRAEIEAKADLLIQNGENASVRDSMAQGDKVKGLINEGLFIAGKKGMFSSYIGSLSEWGEKFVKSLPVIGLLLTGVTVISIFSSTPAMAEAAANGDFVEVERLQAEIYAGLAADVIVEFLSVLPFVPLMLAAVPFGVGVALATVALSIVGSIAYSEELDVVKEYLTDFILEASETELARLIEDVFGYVEIVGAESVLIGTIYDDYFFAQQQTEAVLGFEGDDVLVAPFGLNSQEEIVFVGGTGTDAVSYEGRGVQTLVLSDDTIVDTYGNKISVFEVEEVWGSELYDTLSGSWLGSVYGGEGNDQIYVDAPGVFGGYGDDEIVVWSADTRIVVVDGGLGWDQGVIDTSNATEVLYFDAETASLSWGDKMLTPENFELFRVGQHAIFDTRELFFTNILTFEDSTAGIGYAEGGLFTVVNGALDYDTNLRFVNVDEVYGSEHGDVFGPAMGAVLYGGAGNDVFALGAGDDVVYGDEGSDTFVLGYGTNVVDGGESTYALDGGAVVEHRDVVDYTSMDYATSEMALNIGVEETLVSYQEGYGHTDTLRNIEELRFGNQDVSVIFGTVEHGYRKITSGSGIGVVDFSQISNEFNGTWSSSALEFSGRGRDHAIPVMVVEGFDVWHAGSRLNDSLRVDNALLGSQKLVLDALTGEMTLGDETLQVKGVDRFNIGPLVFVANMSQGSIISANFSAMPNSVSSALNVTLPSGYENGVHIVTRTPSSTQPLSGLVIENLKTLFGTSSNDILRGTTGMVVNSGNGNDMVHMTGFEEVRTSAGFDVLYWAPLDNAWWQMEDGEQVVIDFSTMDFLRVQDVDTAVVIEQDGSDVRLTHSSGKTLLLLNTLVANVLPRIGFEGTNAWYGTPEADTGSWTSRTSGIYARALAGNDTLTGSNHNDTLIGDEGNDWLYGGSGVDALYGDNNDDSLYGGAGSDRIYGGENNDRLYANAGSDTLWGGAGNDTLYADGSSSTADRIVAFGGAGNDTFFADDNMFDAKLTVSYADSPNAITLNANGTANDGWGGVDTLSNIGKGGTSNPHRIVGSNHNDIMYAIEGTSSNSWLEGGLGNDSLYGGGHNNWLYGGTGDDFLWGYSSVISGNANVYGGDGNDTIHGRTASGLNGSGRGVYYGGEGDDFMRFVLGGKEKVYGGSGHDLLYTGQGTIHNGDEFWGGVGSDVFAFDEKGSGLVPIIHDYTEEDVIVLTTRFVNSHGSAITQAGADVRIGGTNGILVKNATVSMIELAINVTNITTYWNAHRAIANAPPPEGQSLEGGGFSGMMADSETSPTLLGIEAVIGFLTDPEGYFGTSGEEGQPVVVDFGAPLWEILEGQEEWWGEYNSYETPIIV